MEEDEQVDNEIVISVTLDSLTTTKKSFSLSRNPSLIEKESNYEGSHLHKSYKEFTLIKAHEEIYL